MNRTLRSPSFCFVVTALCTACGTTLNPIGLEKETGGGGMMDAGAGPGEASAAGTGGTSVANGGGTSGAKPSAGGATGSGGNTAGNGGAENAGGVGTGGTADPPGAGVDSGVDGQADSGTDSGALECAAGTWDNDGDPSTACVPLAVQQLVAGERHTCALLADGTVKCWGLNDHGQLGYPNVQSVAKPSLAGTVSITNTPGVKVLSLAAGWFHTCAVLTDGTAKCWGWNDNGQLGYGNRDDIGDDEAPSSVGPVSVTNKPGVTVTMMGAGRHTCALLSDSTVKCWGPGPLGYGNTADIGDDELPSSVEPISVTTTPGLMVKQIAVGFYHTCALLADGALRCWGPNGYGQLGYGNSEPIGDDEAPSSVGPISVSTIPGVVVVQVVAGQTHTCALLSAGTVTCWGGFFNGKVGVGYGNEDLVGDNELPSAVGPISLTTTPGVTVRSIASGIHHVCARLSDDSVRCWGWNAHGALGVGNNDDIGDDELPSSVGPASIVTTPGVKVSELYAGSASYGTCARLSDGTGKCWGFNSDSELGYGTFKDIGDDELPSSVGPTPLF